uniref:Uncharacterized protein n=1 Tax=Anguilla anguilla TaxID=7936 RepID=A0A0E9TDY7_ANGAN
MRPNTPFPFSPFSSQKKICESTLPSVFQFVKYCS